MNTVVRFGVRTVVCWALVACGGPSGVPRPERAETSQQNATRTASTPSSTAGVVTAVAPDGWTERNLGIPLTALFETYPGADGAPLFTTIRAPQQSGKFSASLSHLDSQAELAANVDVVKVVSAEGSKTSKMSYVLYRAQFVDRIVELDDTNRTRTPPKGAAYYPTRLFFGWRYQFLLYGESSKLSGDVSATIKGIGLGAGGFDERSRIGWKVETSPGFELKPECKDSLFDVLSQKRPPEEMGSCFTRSSNQAEAILVEYRRLPDTGLVTVSVRVRSARIVATGCNAKERCLLSLGLACRVNSRPVRVVWPLVFEGPVKAGDDQIVAFGEDLLLAPGDQLECQTHGEVGAQLPLVPIEFTHEVGTGGTKIETAYPKGTITARDTKNQNWRVAVPNRPGIHTIEFQIYEKGPTP